MAECGRGWANRCRIATGKKCTCKCGGVNHGADLGPDDGQRVMLNRDSANYLVVYDGPEGVVLKDVGPHDMYKTITNAPEQTVAEMIGRLRGRRLFYIDTMHRVDELVILDNLFLRFGPGAPDEVLARLAEKGIVLDQAVAA